MGFYSKQSTSFSRPPAGMYNYGYRYYDPVTGRWPSRDPIGERGGVNLYGFVYNNPLKWTDFLGLDPRPTDEPRVPARDPIEGETWDEAVARIDAEIKYEEGRRKVRQGGRCYKICGFIYARITNPKDDKESVGVGENIQSVVGSHHHFVIDENGKPHGYPHDALEEETVATNHESCKVAAAILVYETESCLDFWECLRKKLKENRGYSTLTNNCQTVLRDMVEECGGKYGTTEGEIK